MKSPDEIKKGLECCVRGNCTDCPYSRNCVAKNADALALIQQLEADNAKKGETIQMLQDGNASLMRMIDEECEKTVTLEAEREAAVACIPRECRYCKHDGTADFDVDSVCDYCLNGNTRFEWRGVQKEATP